MLNLDLSDRAKSLAIIGQGYVGLPLAMAAVDAGWSVIGIEKSAARVAQLNSGSSPVEDISDERLARAIAAKKFIASNDPADVSAASVVTICVPTPLNDAREPDLELLISAVKDVTEHLADETLLVSESTSYPGTLREVIIPIINAGKSNSAQNIYYASAPERVNPGDPVWDQKNTPRLVGGIDAQSQKLALAFYNSICDSVVATATPEIAEAAKILENTFRLVNIALINEFTQLCSAQGINVHDVITAAATKPYGFMPFRPGVGIGGHCIPVDPLYLTWWARKGGQVASLVERSDEIANEMPIYVAERGLALAAKVASANGSTANGSTANGSTANGSTTSAKASRVLIMGVAYKPGVGDVRETPASALRAALVASGAQVAWIDPLVPLWEGSEPVSIAWDCDVAIVATNQPGLDVKGLLARGIPVLDCTNSYGDLPGVELL